MGSHGIMVLGATVAETFNRMYFFERACSNYIHGLMTGQTLRRLTDAVAESVARGTEEYPGQDERHLSELKAILDAEGSDYAS
jgi:ribulose-5-phosphate 4-epimerase/fuculose-1-phosphate aldolase